MLEFFRWLLEFARSIIWPVWIVSSPNLGVRYTRGRPGGVLAPDWYLAFPFFQEIRQTNCAEEVIDVANLPITTWDDVQVTVSYNMRYRIVDVLKYQTIVQEGGVSLHAEASCEVALRIRRRAWKRIYRSQGSIERRITKTMTERVKHWGIEVVHGGMTVCARARPISWIKVD